MPDASEQACIALLGVGDEKCPHSPKGKGIPLIPASSSTAQSDIAAAPGSETPVCTLLHGSTSSGTTSGRNSSLVDTGQSAAAPGTVVDSILTVKALRRSRVSYRSPALAGSPTIAAGGAHGPWAPPPPRRTQLYLKAPGLDPQDLAPGFLAVLDESLRMNDCGLQLVGASVRRGCIELTLDFMERSPGLVPSGGDGATEQQAGAAPTLAALPGPSASRRPSLDLPVLVLAALDAPQLQRLKEVVAADGTAAGGDAVLVQRGSKCWSLQWDRQAMDWRVREGPEGGAATGQQLLLEAPLAMHAATQLDAGCGGQGLARLRLGLWSECEVLQAEMFFGAAGRSASGLGITANDGACPHAEQRAPQLSLVAKANGRTAVARVLAATSRAEGAATAEDPNDSVPIPAAFASYLDLELEFDLGHLAAGRQRSSQGLVVRLELWRGSCIVASVSLACLRDSGAVSELLELQYDVAAAGDLDPEDDGYLSAEQQRAERQELLGDMGAWLDFVVYINGADAGSGLQTEAEYDPLDLSPEVAALLASPAAGPMLLSAGRHLLEYFVGHGLAALARIVYVDWGPRAGGLRDVDGDSGASESAEQLTLLHRAVRSGSKEMVADVLGWVHDEGEACGVGGGAVAVADAWAARGPGGVTPLHFMAADARCGVMGSMPAAALAAGGGGTGPEAPPRAGERGPPYDLGLDAVAATPAEMAEALLRWVIASYPAAVTVWNTARDSSGNTPAMLWSALGGQDVQPQAAADTLTEALAKAFMDGSASPYDTDPDNSRSPHIFAAADVTSSTASTFAGPSDSSVGPTAGAGRTAPAGSDRDLLAAEAQALAVAAVAGATPAGQLRMLLRLALRGGFPSAALERRYVDYVTRTTAGSTLTWVALMVVAHVTAAFKSELPGESRQAIVGGFAYFVSLPLMVLRPRLYAACREELMLSCLLGRTLSRLLMWLLPSVLYMTESVQKYILFGLDVLLDGFMEGTFEPVRIRRVFFARLLEWLVMALFMHSLHLRPSLLSALVRSAVVSSAGLALCAAQDLRMRAAFLEDLRRRHGGARDGKAKAE